MSLGSRDKRIAYSIVRHLQSQSAVGVLSQDGKEGIEIAVQCICEAYGISTQEEEDRRKYEIKTTLEELFSQLPVDASEEDKKAAEVFKQQGNVHLTLKKFSEAIECYTKAIQLDRSNATYYCNRAAAYIKLDDFDGGIEDCKSALSLNPKYARAHGRLGFIYCSLGKYEQSKECFQKALELDPGNESYQSNLQTVEEHLVQPPGAAGVAAGGGGAEGGADPGPLGGLLGMVQNPGFMNMATSLMQTPAFQNMASQMISSGVVPTNMSAVSPDMLSGVTEAARNIQQTNPEVFQNFQQQVLGQQQQPAPGQQQQQPPGHRQQQPGQGGGANPGTDKT